MIEAITIIAFSLITVVGGLLAFNGEEIISALKEMYSDRQDRLIEVSKNHVREKELELKILEKKQANAPKYVRPEQASYRYEDGMRQEQ